ncbi:hypothetical protein C5167_008612 [Papaver somniferum]|uniref:Uncharacterized protein n=1 Tax=Papaver somniferum TaxID=3469 RepID=A0A4Y7JY02_PAPSO|nr:hypothetical protein C5167_008612 [Papaver somniferum]
MMLVEMFRYRVCMYLERVKVNRYFPIRTALRTNVSLLDRPWEINLKKKFIIVQTRLSFVMGLRTGLLSTGRSPVLTAATCHCRLPPLGHCCRQWSSATATAPANVG